MNKLFELIFRIVWRFFWKLICQKLNRWIKYVIFFCMSIESTRKRSNNWVDKNRKCWRQISYKISLIIMNTNVWYLWSITTKFCIWWVKMTMSRIMLIIEINLTMFWLKLTWIVNENVEIFLTKKITTSKQKIVCRLFTTLIDDSKNEFDTSNDNQWCRIDVDKWCYHL